MPIHFDSLGRTQWPVVLLAALCIMLWLFPWRPATADGGIQLVEITGGLAEPVFVTHANDGSGRLFVVEKRGTIRIVQGGQVLDPPFLDIQDRVGDSGEAGLLSVAFPPDDAQSGYFLVYYNHRDRNLVPPPAGEENDGFDTVVARFRVTQDPNRADPASEERLLLVNQPYTNHNGGLVLFAPDGRLYVGLGDGGSGGDPLNAGQRRDTLLGKILRLEVGANGPYAVPQDNPFVGVAGMRGEIWDYGLRNPWRFSFDRATGDLFIGDVGQNAYEEIDLHPAGTGGGLNFGWRCREGFHPYDETPPCPGPLVDPIAEYDHSNDYSVTGGFVYRGVSIPTHRGRYFFGDFASGRIWSIAKTGEGWTAPALELDTGFNIASFGEDAGGELYVVDYGNGRLLRVASTAPPAPDLGASTKQASTAQVTPGQLIRYTVRLDNRNGAASAALTLTDTLPANLTYVPDSLTATAGQVDAAAAPLLRWQGAVAAGQLVEIGYEAIAGGATGPATNVARVTGAGVDLRLSAVVTITAAAATGDPDFILPGTQPGHLVDEIVDPATCNGCHSEPIYGAWRGSMMSQAGRDPLFWAALAVANADAPGSGEFCLRCHVPRGWFAGRSHVADGSALHAGDLSAGIACETCHRMVDPAPTSTSDISAARDAVLRGAIQPPVPANRPANAMLILDPIDNRRGPFALATNPPHPNATWRTDFLGQNGDPVTEARVCGSCHNIDNPTLSWDAQRGQYWPNGADAPAPSLAEGDLFPIERTYDEWLRSDYATAAGVYAPQFAGAKPDGIVRTCQDCHMPRTTGVAANNGMLRDCVTTGCLPVHTLVGGNTWTPRLLQDTQWRLNALADAAALDLAALEAAAMLRKAATLTVTLNLSGVQPTATVRVINESGHKLPTGYAEGRRMWLTVRAFDAAGSQVYISGEYDPATGILAADPDLQVYEVKQGITPELAAELGKTPGASFHFVLNNTVTKDNRIPPRGYTVAAFDAEGLRPVGAVYADGQDWDETVYALPAEAVAVTAVLYYQTASHEYVEFLRENGGADGVTLGELWDDDKSPPVMMAVAMAPVHAGYLPVVAR